MELGHLETNFQRLLVKCEELAENQNSNNWRFDEYVKSLEQQLKKLNGLTANKPSQDTLKDYQKRCDFLKQITVLFSKKNELNETALDHSPVLNNPSTVMNKKDVKQKQIYHRVHLNKENTTRQQLLGYKESKVEYGEDMETFDMKRLMSKQQENQEKLAQEMLKSVESIKNNSLVAKRIVDNDNLVLNKLDTEADKNSKNLATVSGHLSDRVSKSCNCWIWLMIFLILIIFVMMIMFMKLFPKQKYAETSYEDEKYLLINNTLLFGNKSMHTVEL